MPNPPKNCATEIQEHYLGRLEDLELFERYGFGDPENGDWETDVNEDDKEQFGEVGPFHEYGLEFEWREPGTFSDQPAGYYEYLLSTGGPADMFRFHGDGRITYHFQDWGDGALIHCGDNSTVRALAIWFQDCEVMPHFDGVVIF